MAISNNGCRLFHRRFPPIYMIWTLIEGSPVMRRAHRQIHKAIRSPVFRCTKLWNQTQIGHTVNQLYWRWNALDEVRRNYYVRIKSRRIDLSCNRARSLCVCAKCSRRLKGNVGGRSIFVCCTALHSKAAPHQFRLRTGCESMEMCHLAAFALLANIPAFDRDRYGLFVVGN